MLNLRKGCDWTHGFAGGFSPQNKSRALQSKAGVKQSHETPRVNCDPLRNIRWQHLEHDGGHGTTVAKHQETNVKMDGWRSKASGGRLAGLHETFNSHLRSFSREAWQCGLDLVTTLTQMSVCWQMCVERRWAMVAQVNVLAAVVSVRAILERWPSKDTMG